MGRILAFVFLSVVCCGAALAQSQAPAPDATALTEILHKFLDGAGRNDPSAHDAFWAEDLIYTSSSGKRFGKAEILREVRSAPPPKPDDPKTVYGAEDVRIQQYGDTAIVAFRLVGTTTKSGATEVAKYLNSGTFLKRGGAWQAVSWQATRMPADEAPKRAD